MTGAAAAPTGLSNVRRAIGLITLLAATLFICVDRQTWNGWVAGARAMWQSATSSPGQGPMKPPPPGLPRAIPIEDLSEAGAAGEIDLLVVRIALIAVFILGVLLLHGSRSIWFLLNLPITAVLVGLTALAASLLLGAALPWWVTVFGALAVAYLLQTAHRPSQPSLLGMVGLVLVALAGIGELKGWFSTASAWVGSKTGPGPMSFVADWGAELTWAATLFLATLGALWSRTKPMHFLIAVLMGALAFHCVDSGRVVVRTFEILPDGEFTKVTDAARAAVVSDRQDNIKKINDVSFTNVKPWRWVAAGELTVIALVLLYKSLGIGAIGITFALAWVILGGQAYAIVRSASFAGPAYDYLIRPQLGGQPAAIATPTSTPGVIEGMDIPLDPTASAQRVRRPVGPPPPRSPATRSPSTSFLPHPPTNQPAPSAAPAPSPLPPELQLKIARREVGLTLWVYLTAILAGVIGATGLSQLWTGPGYRFWSPIVLWVGLAVACTTLWFMDPRGSGQSWTSWLSDWSQSKYKLHVVWLVFLASTTVCGSWALRLNSRMETWTHASIVCAFIGTALTLIGLALLPYFGGLEPVRGAWKYGLIAAGQSAIAWILMMHLSAVHRRAAHAKG